MKRICYLICTLVFCGLLFGCWGEDDPPESTAQDAIFETTLRILDQNSDEIEVAQQETTVIFSFSFQNVSSEAQTVQFSSSQHYDIEIYDSEDILIWNWANGKTFSAEQTGFVYDVDETNTFTETWDQTANDGTQVPPGIYQVYVNRHFDTDRSTDSKQIEIE